jgi:hypothetical protein
LYRHDDHGFTLGGGSAAVALAPEFGRRGLGDGRFADLDLAVDLGARNG